MQSSSTAKSIDTEEYDPRGPAVRNVNLKQTSEHRKSLHKERFRDANSGYSGYKSAHAHKCTRVVQSRTFRVIKKWRRPMVTDGNKGCWGTRLGTL